MFLFPDPPYYEEELVGQPVFLTPLIRASRIQDARSQDPLFWHNFHLSPFLKKKKMRLRCWEVAEK